MHAYIYHSGNFENRDARVRRDFDFSAYLVTVLAAVTSLKISDIRQLLSVLSVSANRKRLIYIPHAESLTPAGQTALLKALEEPPSATTFVLATDQLSLLLPTIRSRCVLVSVNSPISNVDNDSLSLVKSALSATYGERIILADSLGKDREDLVRWFTTLLSSLHTVISRTDSRIQLTFLRQCASLAASAHSALKSNTAVALTVRNFFLSLPRTTAPVRMKG